MKERPLVQIISKGNYSQNNGNSLEITSGIIMVLVYYTCPQFVLSVFEVYS